MFTPNDMPDTLNDEVLPIREYVMPVAPLTIGERLDMATEDVMYWLAPKRYAKRRRINLRETDRY